VTLPEDCGDYEEAFGVCIATAVFCSTFRACEAPWRESGGAQSGGAQSGGGGSEDVEADSGVASLVGMVQATSLADDGGAAITGAAITGAVTVNDYLKYLTRQFNAACDGLSSSNGTRRAGVAPGGPPPAVPLLDTLCSLHMVHTPAAVRNGHEKWFAAAAAAADAAGCPSVTAFAQYVAVWNAFKLSKAQKASSSSTVSTELPYSHHSHAIVAALLHECSPAAAACVKKCMQRLMGSIDRAPIGGR
jgi:hypothetical protein